MLTKQNECVHDIIEDMQELLTGFVITMIALLIGFSLGKDQMVVTKDVQQQIKQIFKRVVPKSDVGPVMALSQRELDILNNPKLKEEQDIMDREFGHLNNRGGETI